MRKVFALGSMFALAFFCAVALGAQTSDSVGIATDASGQSYLVDSKGMTLYYFTKDQVGESACNGNCIKAWPAFYAPTMQVSNPLVASDFGTITRADGSFQTTFKGWPLYYWVHDAKPGDTTGQGVGKVWFIIDPSTFPAK